MVAQLCLLVLNACLVKYAIFLPVLFAFIYGPDEYYPTFETYAHMIVSAGMLDIFLQLIGILCWIGIESMSTAILVCNLICMWQILGAGVLIPRSQFDVKYGTWFVEATIGRHALSPFFLNALDYRVEGTCEYNSTFLLNCGGLNPESTAAFLAYYSFDNVDQAAEYWYAFAFVIAGFAAVALATWLSSYLRKSDPTYNKTDLGGHGNNESMREEIIKLCNKARMTTPDLAELGLRAEGTERYRHILQDNAVSPTQGRDSERERQTARKRKESERERA